MKIKFSHDIIVYFINNNMNFNVDKEYEKLIRIIDDNKFDFLKFARNSRIMHKRPRINFLWIVLNLTTEYPQVELYLKDILQLFTNEELENVSTIFNRTILHLMMRYPTSISLNSFEIIIKCGINLNIINAQNDTPTHILFQKQCTNYKHDILNLLIKYGADLNIIGSHKATILDTIAHYQITLSEEAKNCIMLLVDFGARTDNPEQNNEIYDFIEYYKSSTIKPAIKNENRI